MILYRMAKWMEERNRLNYTIHHSNGNVDFLVKRKADVEVKMLEHAKAWLGEEKQFLTRADHSEPYNYPQKEAVTETPAAFMVEPLLDPAREAVMSGEF